MAVPAGSGFDGPASEVKKRLNASMIVDGGHVLKSELLVNRA
jgi:hypothetical protein